MSSVASEKLVGAETRKKDAGLRMVRCWHYWCTG